MYLSWFTLKNFSSSCNNRDAYLSCLVDLPPFYFYSLGEFNQREALQIPCQNHLLDLERTDKNLLLFLISTIYTKY